MDKSKHLTDYSPDFHVELKHIITVQDTLEKMLSVRHMDIAATKLFVNVKS